MSAPSNNPITLKKTMLNALDPATNCTFIIINITPDFHRMPNPNCPMKNKPRQIIFILVVVVDHLKARLAPNRGPLVNGTASHCTLETGKPRYHQTIYIKRIKLSLFLPYNKHLINRAESICMENLDLRRVYRPHWVRSVLTS